MYAACAPVESFYTTTPQRIEILSWEPRIFRYPDFLSPEECEHLIHLAEPELEPGGVIDPATGIIKPHPARTSWRMFIFKPDPIVQAIEARIAAVSMIPASNCEAIQVVRYAVGEQYKPHVDYFDPAVANNAQALGRGGQRLGTFIMYLNDVQAGGETGFQKAGISVPPVKGSAVLFYNCTPDGEIDPMSLHSGEPVVEGEKWCAIRLLRERVFR